MTQLYIASVQLLHPPDPTFNDGYCLCPSPCCQLSFPSTASSPCTTHHPRLWFLWSSRTQWLWPFSDLWRLCELFTAIGSTFSIVTLSSFAPSIVLVLFIYESPHYLTIDRSQKTARKWFGTHIVQHAVSMLPRWRWRNNRAVSFMGTRSCHNIFGSLSLDMRNSSNGLRSRLSKLSGLPSTWHSRHSSLYSTIVPTQNPSCSPFISLAPQVDNWHWNQVYCQTGTNHTFRHSPPR